MDIKTLCLGLLTSGEATGYDLKKHFESTFSHFYTAGYGSIYPALADLSEAGLVTCAEVAEAGRPARKIYTITEAGRARFAQALAGQDCPCHKIKSEFLAMMYFAQQMPREQVLTLLQSRLEHIDDTLAMLTQLAQADSAEQEGPAFVRGFGETVMTAARGYIAAYMAQEASRTASDELVA